jgi:hypothetical protein
MPEALLWLPFLLVPVLALLFLNLRLSRKLRYPHDLLRADERRGLGSLLFRNFRTYYDLLLDGLIALVLAFAIAPPPWHRPAAVVIDGSRSMYGGFADARPIAKALKKIQSDPGLKHADPFLLVLDPQARTTRMVPIRSYLTGSGMEEAILHLRDDFDFFAPDYARLSELRQRGYGEITLLTDQLRVKPVGFDAVELGFAVNFAAYPTSVRFDHASETWLVALAENGPRVPLTVSAWDKSVGTFTKLPPDRYGIEEGMAGRIVRLPVPGLYLMSLKGPFGLDDIDLPLLLPARSLGAAADGAFSKRMLSVFPEIDRTLRPSLALVDQGTKAHSGIPVITTRLIPNDGHQLVDPGLTSGALLAAGTAPGGSFAWGPSSLKNEDLVLAYDAFLSNRPPAFQTSVPPGTRALHPVGTAYLAETGSGLVPLLPPASQFFEQRAEQRLLLPPPASWRWPWALLLSLLLALKVYLWVRLTGKSWITRD